jgi:ABC-type Na+ efflux pump permease subunit
MVAVAEMVTADVVVVNVAVELPALTVTEAGVEALALLSDSDTTMPPAGAGPVRVTVPVEEVPPVTLAGLTDTAESATAGGVMVSDEVRVTPL